MMQHVERGDFAEFFFRSRLKKAPKHKETTRISSSISFIIPDCVVQFQ